MRVFHLHIHHHADPRLESIEKKIDEIHAQGAQIIKMTTALKDAVARINTATNDIATSQVAIGTAVGRVGIDVAALVKLKEGGASAEEVSDAVGNLTGAADVLAAAKVASEALAASLNAIAASAEDPVPPEATPPPLPEEIPPVA